MKRNTSAYAERLREIRRAHPRAYERWSAEDLALLRKIFDTGAGPEMLAKALQRQPSAIIARLERLGLVPPDPREMTRPTCSFGLGPINLPNESAFGREVFLGFEWRPVYAADCAPYAFPGPVTAFMEKRYSEPAVYRWLVHRDGDDQPEWLYVGSTKRLCPDRLQGYLAPEKSKTNTRVSHQLRRSLQEGSVISLEILSEGSITMGNHALSPGDLRADSVRLAVERLLIVCYRQQGIRLLNL